MTGEGGAARAAGAGRARQPLLAAESPPCLRPDDAAEYRRRRRAVEAAIVTREIAQRYPFAAAIPHLKAERCRLGLLFAGGGGGGGGGDDDRRASVLDAAAKYVVASIGYGSKPAGAGAGGGRGGGRPAARGASRLAAGIADVEIDGASYCGVAVVHAVGVMIAHVCGRHAAAKFAMGQAEWAIANMRADVGGGMDGDDGANFASRPAKFAHDYLWCLMPHERDGDGRYKMGVQSYVARSIHLADPHWKLVNRRVVGGAVVLGEREITRLARHDVFAAVDGDVAAARTDRAAEAALAGVVARVRGRAMAPAPAAGAAAAARTRAGSRGTAPCVAAAVAELEAAKNVPHHGRLLVAAYMLRAGMTEEDVGALFRGAPDYSEAVTSAQVRQIAGAGYMPQSCEKLESLGLCRRTAECGSIRNPVQFVSRGQK